MLVLGLETSCDETGVALYDSERGLLADALFSQIDLHRAYGGVVPELASRDHVKRMLPLIRQVLDEAGCVATDIDAIAYTAGPGLVGALLVGASCAQALAFAWDIPAIGVHHMEGHLLAPMLEPTPPTFPFVALLVSGRPYPAGTGRRHRSIPVARRVAGRCGRRSLRQDRQADGPALPGWP